MFIKLKKYLICTIIIFIFISCVSFATANENITTDTTDDNIQDTPTEEITSNNDNANTDEKENNANEPLNNDVVNSSRYHYVTGDTFKDIQDAIDAASDNDIIVLNGTYKGNGNQIIINKSITITSNGNYSVIDANKLSRCFYIPADNVTLNNLKIINGAGKKPVSYN